MSLNFSPYVQTNAQGTFNVSADGLVQGFAMADPAARNWLSSGVLAATETLPMWGGLAISENVPPASAGGVSLQQELGGNVIRATAAFSAGTAGAVTGFSVFDQNYSAVNTPQSPVPLLAAGATLNFFRFGSNVRIAVACDPTLTADDGGLIVPAALHWDTVTQSLVRGESYTATITGAVWTAGDTVLTVGTDPTSAVKVGDTLAVSGVTPATYNGQYPVLARTSTTITLAGPSADPGAYVSGGTVAAPSSTFALPTTVRLLKIAPINSMIVAYDPVTGFATWNRNGAAALILI